MSVLKAQPRQCVSKIYIYLYVSDQFVYTGSEFILSAINSIYSKAICITFIDLKPNIVSFYDVICLCNNHDQIV